MIKALLFLLALTTLTGSTQADIEVGGSLPFYVDEDLSGGGLGGYGLHVEAQRGSWFLAYDRVQNAVRNKGKIMDNANLLTLGKRVQLHKGAFLQTGLALNESSNVLGNAVSFNIGLGYQVGRYRVTWSHWSNADTDEVNHGIDVLTLSYNLRRSK